MLTKISFIPCLNILTVSITKGKNEESLRTLKCNKIYYWY